MTFDIDGISIDFPYEPYECQTKFMEHVIGALKNQQNALLESPTGTGKTLSLLCSTLAYVQSQKERFKLGASNLQAAGMQDNKAAAVLSSRLFPQIIYASRTHSQLKQVVRELNKTNYKGSIQVAFLAGREQLCLDSRVQREPNSNSKSQICRTLVRSRQCVHYNNLDAEDTDELKKKYADKSGGNVMDLEDMLETGLELKQCPFYRMRKVQPSADLILLPYNYILDPKIRETFKVNLEGNILIFDEAHNISNIAEESISMSISTAAIAQCIRETQDVLESMVEDEEQVRADAENDPTPLHERTMQPKDEEGEWQKLKKDDVAQLLDLLLKFDEELAKFWKNPPDTQMKAEKIPGRVFPGNTIVQLLNAAGISAGNSRQMGTIIDRIGLFWMKKDSELHSGGKGLFSKKVVNLPQFSSFISRVFSLGLQALEDDIYDLFRLYVTPADVGSGFVLGYWCFSPQIAMRHLQAKKPHSIILTSGTLSPMDNFVRSMGIPFLYVLQNQHAAQSNQVIVRPLRYAPNRVELLGTYQNRDSPAYMQAIGEVIFGVTANVPQGMLVFFASYAQMNKFINSWKMRNSLGQSRWTALERLKKLFVEPSNRAETQLAFREFDMEVRDGKKGAMMFAVCRGKMSEGIDFADCHCRAVIVVGIPYPPLMEPRIVLKKKFLTDRIMQKKEEISPGEWYQTEAIRAVNQALGRIIRHKDDFGVVVLADSRFETLPMNVFPAWTQNSIRNETEPGKLFAEVRRFFSERLLLVERSQEQSAFQGSLTIHKRRVVTPQVPTPSREDDQFDEFLVTAQMYGFGNGDSIAGPSTEKAFKSPQVIPSTQSDGGSVQKRKAVKIVPNSKRAAASSSSSTSTAGNSQQQSIKSFLGSSPSASSKEPDQKRSKPVVINID